MFDNFSNTYLWDITKINTKDADTETPKMEWEGEERGQTERFMIGLSRLLKNHYNRIEELFEINDFHRIPSKYYDLKLRSMGLTFIPTDLTQEKKREIIKNYPIVKRTLGTRAFVEWMVWMILGWEVASLTIEKPENLIEFYDDVEETGEGIISYMEGQTQTFIFFDDNAKWILTVIPTGSGMDVQIKSDWLKSKLKEWFLSSEANFTI
jgi:hypothetical protein